MNTVVDKEISTFKFKSFEVQQNLSKMKVGTDGILTGALANLVGVDTVLDIGTGTGLISLMLAQRDDQVVVDAVEIDPDAASEAKLNFKSSSWHERLNLHECSIQDFAANSKIVYDLIITNPPFFTGGVLSYNQDRNTARHTVKLSHSDLLKSVRNLLSKEGRFSCILPFMEGKRFSEMAATYGMNLVECISIKSFADDPVIRLFQTFSRRTAELKEENLILYKNKNQDRTDSFAELTKEFYL